MFSAKNIKKNFDSYTKEDKEDTDNASENEEEVDDVREQKFLDDEMVNMLSRQSYSSENLPFVKSTEKI